MILTYRTCLSLLVIPVSFLGYAAPLSGQPFPSQNVTLQSWLPLTSFTPTPGNGNDCWGYVSPSGREYALMGLSNQLAVVEITNPVSSVIVGSVSHTNSLWAGIKVYGSYCYVSNEAGGGIDVVDLSNVDSGGVTLVQRFTGGGVSTTHTLAVNADSGHLYLCGANINGGAIVAVSLADPANPVIAGMWNQVDAAYTHEAQVVTYASGPFAGREIAFCSDGSTAFDIVDVTNKSNMFLVARRTYPNLGYCHQGWLSEDRRYFYINDESDGINSTIMFDVSDIANPVFVGTYSAGDNATDHNQYVRGQFIYESDYRGGLRIYCAENPTAPVKVGYFDTFPENNDAGFSGSWSNYPFFPSGIVLISDMNRGLFVVDVSQALAAGAITYGYPTGRPSLISPMGGTRVRVQLTASCGATLNASSPLLFYNTGSGYMTAPLELVGPGEYDAVFPPIPCETAVAYYVTAESSAGGAFLDPPNAPTTTYSATSATGINVLLNDDFELDGGWTVGDPGSPDTATAGIWNRADPEQTLAQPGDDHTPPPGVMCWVTDSRGGNPGQFDVDGGKTTLMSPIFDLGALPNARITYWRWYSNVGGTSPNQDVFKVDVSNNNGGAWVNAETVGPAGPGTSGGWLYHEFRVSDFVAQTSQVKVRFVASDLGNDSRVEAAVDDFQIYAYECNIVCLKGDVNHDGVLDGRDAQGFVDAMVRQLDFGSLEFCAADMDSDQALEAIDDVDSFVNCLLGNGCP